MRRCVGLVVGDWNDLRDDVREPRRRAYLRHLLAEAWMMVLEKVAVAGQRPHLNPAVHGDRPPAEHRAVEGPRAFNVAGVEAVEVQRARVVDDSCTRVLLRLPDAEQGPLGIGEDRHPASVHDVEGLHHDGSAGIADR
jgi:hypothetical protein